jgi:hypothetical protein
LITRIIFDEECRSRHNTWETNAFVKESTNITQTCNFLEDLFIYLTHNTDTWVRASFLPHFINISYQNQGYIWHIQLCER